MAALHYAAYYKDDVRFITPLLEYGADTEPKMGMAGLPYPAQQNKIK
jgi:hypothetical protein